MSESRRQRSREDEVTEQHTTFQNARIVFTPGVGSNSKNGIYGLRCQY